MLNPSTLSWEDNKEQLLNMLPGCLEKLLHLSEPFSGKFQERNLIVCTLIQQEVTTNHLSGSNQKLKTTNF